MLPAHENRFHSRITRLQHRKPFKIYLNQKRIFYAAVSHHVRQKQHPLIKKKKFYLNSYRLNYCQLFTKRMEHVCDFTFMITHTHTHTRIADKTIASTCEWPGRVENYFLSPVGIVVVGVFNGGKTDPKRMYVII